jgi:hypothetical protein
MDDFVERLAPSLSTQKERAGPRLPLRSAGVPPALLSFIDVYSRDITIIAMKGAGAKKKGAGETPADQGMGVRRRLIHRIFSPAFY